MSPPVVIICKDNLKPSTQTITEYAIKQSLFYENPTYLLSDFSINIKHEKFQQIPLIELENKDSQNFNTNYIHMSSNHVEFEKTCIWRHIIMKNFMEGINIKKIFHIDYDVLLYCNISDIISYYEHYDFTLSKGQAPSNSFFSIEFYKDFVSKINMMYEQKENHFWFRDLSSIYTNMKKLSLKGGICDMTLLKHYNSRKECNDNYIGGEMTQIVDNKTFDHHIKHGDREYEMENNIKNIKFINNIPYCFNLSLSTNIRFLSLHFQGTAKEYLHEYTTYDK